MCLRLWIERSIKKQRETYTHTHTQSGAEKSTTILRLFEEGFLCCARLFRINGVFLLKKDVRGDRLNATRMFLFPLKWRFSMECGVLCAHLPIHKGQKRDFGSLSNSVRAIRSYSIGWAARDILDVSREIGRCKREFVFLEELTHTRIECKVMSTENYRVNVRRTTVCWAVNWEIVWIHVPSKQIKFENRKYYC